MKKRGQRFHKPTKNELSRTGQSSLYGTDTNPVVVKKKRGSNFHPKKKKRK